jgi:sirohydrochlorin ferrochelatase
VSLYKLRKMRKIRLSSVCGLALLASVLSAGCTTEGSGQQVADTHQHTMHMQNVTADAEGRQLYGMAHELSPEIAAELRENNIFPDLTDAQIGTMMQRMGSNYVWYVSDSGLRGRQGVLILAHGFGDHGDRTLRDNMQPVGDLQPTAFAFGMSMAMSDHIQLALNDLTAAGAEEIVVIPAASSRYSTLMRQWEYIFGMRDGPEYASVPKVHSNSKLLFARPMEDHPLVAEMLIDHAAEISRDPAREEVIIVAHGPVDEEDNKIQLATMENLAGYLRNRGYAGVYPVTLQDDAPPEVRAENVRNIRQLVADIHARDNEVLVITNLLGTRMVQRSIRRDLNGLGYKYNFKGLVQHRKFIDWVNVSVDAASADSW